jgi:hypothetical protein
MPLPLPIEPGSASPSDVDAAIEFLRLPVWSHGYQPCNATTSEVSCFELVRAANTVRAWESLVSESKTIGDIYIDVKEVPFADRFSMLYHGLQIAAYTTRAVFVDRKKFGSIQLPAAIKQIPDKFDGEKLKDGPMFTCSDLSARNPKLIVDQASWPQVLYTHGTVAPWLRATFGFHAAYFLGNYLFGETAKPGELCRAPPIAGIEAFEFSKGAGFLPPSEYSTMIQRCGLAKKESFLVVLGQEKVDEQYHEIVHVDSDAEDGLVCAMRKLTSARRIVHTFGSRFGFWATALQGTSGGFVNGLDRICVNTSNSQQGSIWHTYCPSDRSQNVFRSNSVLFPCSPEASLDVRLFARYLLW